LTVYIDINPDASGHVYALEDTLPTGWTASSFSNSAYGGWDVTNRKVKWFSEGATPLPMTPITLSYVITPSATDTGMKYFSSAVLSVDGVNTTVTQGAPNSAHPAELGLGLDHPADVNNDGIVTPSEALSYGACRITTCVWSHGGPASTTTEFVNDMLRAGVITRTGSRVYGFNPNLTTPLWWTAP